MHSQSRLIFIGSLAEEQWIWEKDRWCRLCKIGFVQGPQTLNDATGRTTNPETIARGFSEPLSLVVL
jgi:hypothetical protein